MIVHVEGAVFGATGGSGIELLNIIHLCAIGTHALVLEPGAWPLAARWCDALGGAMADTAREELRLARRRGTDVARRGRVRAEVCVEARDGDDWGQTPPRLGLHSAWRFLHLPLRVIVENVRSDGAFLRAMLRGEDGEYLRAAASEGRLEFQQGGGLGEIRHLVDAMVDDVPARCRAVVVFDHDGLRPDEPAPPSRELRSLCQTVGVSHHQLRRRAIENYIPIKALRRWAERSPIRQQAAREQKVGALASLASFRAALRCHYNMKGGLCGDMRDALPAPFDEVPDALLEELATGFGDKLATQVYDNPDAPIQESWIRDDGAEPELRHVANLLIERL